MSTADAQNCQDLMISEIVFGTEAGASIQGQTSIFNHSVELYNPTDLAIDLSNYQVDLLAESGSDISISLQGIIPAEGVFVLSHTTSNVDITAVSDNLEQMLNYEGRVAIQLSKTNGDVIDKFGRTGVENNAPAIDLHQFLNDPQNYLSTHNINLGSLEELLVRRKPQIQKGKNNFQDEDIVNEWRIYSNSLIDNLGEHLNACLNPVITWEETSIDRSVIEVSEGYSETVYGKIVIDGTLDYAIQLEIANGTYSSNVYPSAWYGNDFDLIPSPQDQVKYIWIPAGPNEVNIPLCDIFDDNIVEGSEITWFSVRVSDDPDFTFAYVDQPELLELVIHDNDGLSLNDANTIADLELVPTATKGEFRIVNLSNEVSIEDVRIFDMTAKILRCTTYDNMVYLHDHTNGTILVNIRTNYGNIIKRGLVIN